MKTPLVPTVLLCLLVGAGCGYGTLAAGYIAAILALFLCVLLISRPEQIGSFLTGYGVAGLIVLVHLILTCLSPSCHYDVSTPIAMVIFGLIAVAGAVWLGLAIPASVAEDSGLGATG